MKRALESLGIAVGVVTLTSALSYGLTLTTGSVRMCVFAAACIGLLWGFFYSVLGMGESQ